MGSRNDFNKIIQGIRLGGESMARRADDPDQEYICHTLDFSSDPLPQAAYDQFNINAMPGYPSNPEYPQKAWYLPLASTKGKFTKDMGDESYWHAGVRAQWLAGRENKSMYIHNGFSDRNDPPQLRTRTWNIETEQNYGEGCLQDTINITVGAYIFYDAYLGHQTGSIPNKRQSALEKARTGLELGMIVDFVELPFSFVVNRVKENGKYTVNLTPTSGAYPVSNDEEGLIVNTGRSGNTIIGVSRTLFQATEIAGYDTEMGTVPPVRGVVSATVVNGGAAPYVNMKVALIHESIEVTENWGEAESLEITNTTTLDVDVKNDTVIDAGLVFEQHARLEGAANGKITLKLDPGEIIDGVFEGVIDMFIDEVPAADRAQVEGYKPNAGDDIEYRNRFQNVPADELRAENPMRDLLMNTPPSSVNASISPGGAQRAGVSSASAGRLGSLLSSSNIWSLLLKLGEITIEVSAGLAAEVLLQLSQKVDNTLTISGSIGHDIERVKKTSSEFRQSFARSYKIHSTLLNDFNIVFVKNEIPEPDLVGEFIEFRGFFRTGTEDFLPGQADSMRHQLSLMPPAIVTAVKAGRVSTIEIVGSASNANFADDPTDSQNDTLARNRGAKLYDFICSDILNISNPDQLFSGVTKDTNSVYDYPGEEEDDDQVQYRHATVKFIIGS